MSKSLRKAEALIEANTPIAFRLAKRDERIATLEAALWECLSVIGVVHDENVVGDEGMLTDALRHRALLKKEGGAP